MLSLEIMFGNRFEDHRKPHVKSNIGMTTCVEKPLYVSGNRKSNYEMISNSSCVAS
jgi:hypothetical protein